MKIILSIIFIFLSAQSFSGELDGKGLDCDVKVVFTMTEEIEIDRTIRQVFWFNNGSVVQASVRYNTLGGLEIKPHISFIDNTKGNQVNLRLSKNYVEWSVKIVPPYKTQEIKVNRKTLKITNNLFDWIATFTKEKEEKPEVILEGKCTVFSGFDYVKQFQEEMKANILKSLEDNKI